MSDAIVRRLRKKDNLAVIKESFERDRLYEKEDDEEVIDEEPELEEDPEVEDIPAEEREEDIPDDNTHEEDDYVDPEGNSESDNKEGTGEDSEEYINPLDNHYAVKYTIGDEVLVAYSNGTKSKLRGQIEGYDKEGFYRILWSNGLTTNGITDSALSPLVSHETNEDKCVCGGTKFVNEGKRLVCDKCGRYIKESLDQLTLADKSRPKGKRMIRSEAHPVSTAHPSGSIGEAIRKAIKGKKEPINEEYEDDSIDLIKKAIRGDSGSIKELEHRGYKINKLLNPLSSAEVGTYEVKDKSGKTYNYENTLSHYSKLKLSNSIKEDYEEDERSEEDEFGPFRPLINNLKGEFWTRLSEIEEDIISLGYTVDEINDEYVSISHEDEEGDISYLVIPIGGTSRTKTLDFDRISSYN